MVVTDSRQYSVDRAGMVTNHVFMARIQCEDNSIESSAHLAEYHKHIEAKLVYLRLKMRYYSSVILLVKPSTY